jgi:hypothetical protein
MDLPPGREELSAAILADPAAWPDIVLWHVTGAASAETVLREGMRHRSYWSCDGALVDYYADVVRDERATPAFVACRLADIPVEAREADRPGYDEPITGVLGDEDEVRAAYDAHIAAGSPPWAASLLALGSLRCACALPASALADPTSAAPRP